LVKETLAYFWEICNGFLQKIHAFFCAATVLNRSHFVTGWMVRFILENAKIVGYNHNKRKTQKRNRGKK